MDQNKKDQRFRIALLIVGSIFTLGIFYGSGMRSQTKKLKAQNDTLVTARRDLRLSQMDLRGSQAIAQQLEARRQVALALLELDKRNFGAAQGHLAESASRLETIQKANDAAHALKPQQPPVSTADFTAIASQLKKINLEATQDTGTQRQRLLAIANQMDTILEKSAPRPDAEFAAITIPPPTLNDVPQVVGNDVTQN